MEWVTTPLSFNCSPIVFALRLIEHELPAFEAFLQKPENAVLRRERIRFVAYICKEDAFFATNYPINILRNLGILNTATSHYVVLDMDMWMSGGGLQSE